MSLYSTTIFHFLLSKVFETYQVYYTVLFIALNSFLLLVLRIFSVFLKSLSDYFFSWLAYKSLLNRFSVLINYTVLYGLPVFFSAINCLSRFSWSRLSRVQVFQGPGFSGSGSRPRLWVQALEVARSINMFIEEHVNMQSFYKAFVKLL